MKAWQPVPPTVALVDASGMLGAHELARLAAALVIQAREHLGPAWQTAPVSITAEPDPPEPVWTITIYDEIPKGKAAGFHQTEHLQPYANVDLSISGDAWTTVVSHELLEMLVDPWGYRMWWARAPEEFPEGDAFPFVPYLVEVCDPCPFSTYTIDIGDGGQEIEVSDFVLPQYFMHHEGFTHVGPTSAIAQVPARGVLAGGYLSFRHPQSGAWWLKQDFEGKGASVETLPQELDIGSNLREQVDAYVRSRTAGRKRSHVKKAAPSRAPL